MRPWQTNVQHQLDEAHSLVAQLRERATREKTIRDDLISQLKGEAEKLKGELADANNVRRRTHLFP